MRFERLGRRRSGSADLAVWACVAVALILIAAADSTEPTASSRDLDLLGLLLIAGCALVLHWRRTMPEVVALAVLGLTGTWHALGYSSSLINVTALVALYSLGYHGSGARQLVVLAVGVAGVAAGVTLFAEEDTGAQLVAAVGWTLAPFLFGQVVRSRQEVMEGLAERARRAEQDRDEEVRRQIERERIRIAREMHDVLAHTVSAMSVQAGVALDAFEREPEATRDALVAMRRSSREAVNEIRAALNLLRAGVEPGPGDLAPAPSLAQVDDLLAVARDAGLAVDLEVRGQRRPLMSLTELTAYRVVQEALTNVMRHAAAATVSVRLDFGPAALTVEVSDDGRGSGDVQPGLGLRGMRERVESAGGTLSYGNTGEGGFGILVELPLDDSRSQT